MWLTDGSIGTSGDPIAFWDWTMTGGNPATAASQNTSVVYSTAGTHTVSLIVTSLQGCKDTVIQQVIVYNNPIASFSWNTNGNVVTFTDSSTSTDGSVNMWQ